VPFNLKDANMSGSEFSTIAEARVNGSISSDGCISSSAQKVTDFVWAIRLAKISKGLLDREWFHETFSKGATFGLGGEMELGEKIRKTLESERLLGLERVNVVTDDDIFVVQKRLEARLISTVV